MRNLRKITATILALCMVTAMSVSAFAANGNLTTEGGSQNTAVFVQVNGPTFDVTVPTSVVLALSVGSDGDNYMANTITPQSVNIQNHSTLPVEVKSAAITNIGEWTLKPYSDGEESFAALTKNTTTYGFAVNGASAASGQNLDLSGWATTQIAAATGTLALDFDARFGPWTRDCATTQVARVTFTIGWPDSLGN